MKSWFVAPCAALVALLVAASGPATASVSAFATAPDDPAAVMVRGKGDGRADDGAAIQAAIDAAAAKPGGGLVFLPSGRYRISKTLFLWPGVRVFGVGTTRPRILLGDATPGFQKGVANMVIFAGAKPDPARRVPFPPPGSVPLNKEIADANSATFYSAMSNIDFEIGRGNPAATAIRFHAAQHAFLSHMEFDIGSGLAGLYQVGNAAEDLRFKGGRYGILTEKTSPAWGFVLLDSTFEGQRDAAIREHEAGLTLVNVAMRDTPVGIEIDRGYGDWLWGKDVRFENVSKAAVVISNENNVYTQVGFENAVAANTPVFARFRDSGATEPGRGRAYRVSSFTYGLTLPGLGQMGVYKTDMKADAIPSLPAPRPPAIRALPAVSDWANVRALGAKGDNAADDTAAIQKTIDAHRVVYFPAGFYRVTDTLKLRPDTVLIGLHPSLTQIVLPDGTPAYQGVGAPKALVASAAGGDAIVSGLGLNTGGINPRATALLWTAGAQSLVDDVKFQGGHGTNLADGTRFNPYNANATADPDPAKRWAGQYPSLWVTNGGGGTFANLWSPSTYAYSGIYVSDTQTPGHVYQASVEHHVRSEISLNRVANWEFLAPQTEEEAGEGEDTVSLEIRDSHDILLANYHAYRVTRTRRPAAAAVKVYNSRDIRFRNVAVNGESGFPTCDENGCATFLRLTKYPYENAIQDLTSGLEVRERQFAALDLTGDPPPVAPSVFPAGARVEKLADGFYSLGGGAVDAAGTLYFTDRRHQRIYSWSAERKLSIVRDNTLDPVNLAVDGSGNLLVLSSDGRDGAVYSFRPGRPDTEVTVIAATPAADHPAAATVLPVNWWNNGEFKDQLDPETYQFTTLAQMFARDMALPKPREYVSPDGSLILPAYRVFQQGPPDFRGLRFSDALDTYGFTTARPGQRVFIANSSENKTYSGLVGQQGAITDLKPFADRGGESVATDGEGRVYVANGQVFVYAPDGRELGRLDVPERPLQLVFGGPDKRTLFVLTHHALYAVRGQ
ncbi:glycosyl hydrolase family 28-related protein [Caulobacter sp. UNC279MFTsu5.1]|uniref:glycosyl hydrolase family 28-related protein n=1 Tax=Caulobacter sp. UNC279MFTsu5.1 TaxID=1502775 RepID=UPI00035D947C|nr:glycosyl hydrolase family 28-related protein [Caulobacter sp. UNC279MFTsu5.1]SFJ36766.1 Sugar lactone lactonase YvrE [Caulobacter sp. UNC279MFTsu5.1]